MGGEVGAVLVVLVPVTLVSYNMVRNTGPVHVISSDVRSLASYVMSWLTVPCVMLYRIKRN